MLRFVVVASLIVCATAGGYGGSSGGGGGYGGMKSSGGGYGGGRSSGGYGGGMSLGGQGGQQGGQTVQAAIQTKHQIEFRDVPSTGSVNPTTIEVGANSVPLQILFRSASSNLNIQQAHDGAQGSNQETSSEDEPHRLVHSVTKPIIQEVHEVITPFRKITQEIQPVQEEILTIVARGQEQQRQQSSGAAFGGAKSSGGFGGSFGGGKSSGGYGGASMAKSSGGYGGSSGRSSGGY